MFAAFGVARQVHELLWYLDEARERAPELALDAEWARLVDDDPATCDVDAARERVSELLRAASERLRTPPGGESHSRHGDRRFRHASPVPNRRSRLRQGAMTPTRPTGDAAVTAGDRAG